MRIFTTVTPKMGTKSKNLWLCTELQQVTNPLNVNLKTSKKLLNSMRVSSTHKRNTMANKKKWFDTKKEALEVAKKRGLGVGCFKKKFGRNKGKFYVGYEIEFINLNS